MSKPETTSLLFEIGCEEIPARFLEDGERGFGEQLRLALQGNRLLVAPDGNPIRTRDEAPLSPLCTYSTPRRLTAYMPSVLTHQRNKFQRIEGPPVKVAIGADGKYTRAAEGFAAKYNAKPSDLTRIVTAKGEYLALDVTVPGRSALEVLVDVLEVAVLWNLYPRFPKNMYWTAKAGALFVRPIRWIMALLGEGEEAQVVPFEFAGVKSGQYTFGHRLKEGGPIRVAGFEDYLRKLQEHMVEPDPKVRRERTQNGIKVLLEGSESKAVADKWLEEWVVNSTEWPVPLMGGFDPRYLALPREVLVTVMRDHQKYFAVEDGAGKLQPHFITVLNVPGDPKGLIRQGHERVLAARFADAEFFWNADQKITLAERVPMLERVTYQAKLGTYADKVKRMKALAEYICEELEKSGSMNAAERQHALRAVELCKCDLTTQMVQEFTELQGIMGGLYAKAQGEPAEVADAIYDHYRPVGIGDSCPRSVAGAVVSLADKLDSVVAGFSAGLEPTGSSDPFGLRRAGNGIIKVSVEVLPGLNLHDLLRAALVLDVGLPFTDALEEKISMLLRERLEFYLASASGMKHDTVRAVIHSWWGWAIPSQTVERARALEKVRDSDDFEALSIAAKRTRNILHKSASLDDFGGSRPVVRVELLKAGAEQKLFEAYAAAKGQIEEHESQGDFASAFGALAHLRRDVDRFFDDVLVMDPDAKVRANRLALLALLNTDVFSRLADLSEIGNVGAPTLPAGKATARE